ncbi:hypothetical protein K458DRAFT_396757 [Lentithecium fluviatile CBS 122367]|uniref:PAS-like domain-containing protein n=1 Tax=Lentithecium fluviatile CBS 122367 TaxID=1168545 RepID=A0A6G1IED4_9PLEO|nr:hypothetical protein K458DRAFT_396757 [Lentithecium fluviatile CBS 122367]
MAFSILQPLPQPGLPLFHGFTAQRPETFFVKADKSYSSRAQYSVSFMTNGVVGSPLLRIDEEEKRVLVFRLVDGREVMRIVKQVHKWSGNDPEYHGHAPDGSRLWHVVLHRGTCKTEYRLALSPKPDQARGFPLSVGIEKKVASGDYLGIMVNGNLATTVSKPNSWKLKKENTVNVAPGMDILLALGVNWIRFDKQDMDAKAISNGIDGMLSFLGCDPCPTFVLDKATAGTHNAMQPVYWNSSLTGVDSQRLFNNLVGKPTPEDAQEEPSSPYSPFQRWVSESHRGTIKSSVYCGYSWASVVIESCWNVISDVYWYD